MSLLCTQVNIHRAFTLKNRWIPFVSKNVIFKDVFSQKNKFVYIYDMYGLYMYNILRDK